MGTARGPRHRAVVPPRLPRRPVATHRRAGRRHRPPPRRRRPPAAGGVTRGAGRARPPGPGSRCTAAECRTRSRPRCAACPRTGGPGGCSAAGTAACSSCPNSAGCRTSTWPPSPPGTSPWSTAPRGSRTPPAHGRSRPSEDPVVCGSCAVVRWLRALDLVITRPGKRDLARALKKAKAVTGGSPHLCRSTRRIDPATMVVPLLPPIDQWGYIPFPVQRLTPHSLSRRVRDLLDWGSGCAPGPARRHRRRTRSQTGAGPAPEPGRCTPGTTHSGRGPAAAQTWRTSPGLRTPSNRSTPGRRNCSSAPRPSWPRKPTDEP